MTSPCTGNRPCRDPGRPLLVPGLGCQGQGALEDGIPPSPWPRTPGELSPGTPWQVHPMAMCVGSRSSLPSFFTSGGQELLPEDPDLPVDLGWITKKRKLAKSAVCLFLQGHFKNTCGKNQSFKNGKCYEIKCTRPRFCTKQKARRYF